MSQSHNPERARLAQNILDMMAGVEFETAIAAQCDALATLVGAMFHRSGKTLHETEEALRTLVRDMMLRQIRTHWGTIEVEDVYAFGES